MASHFRWRRNSQCAAVSTPSATTNIPSSRAIVRTVRTMLGEWKASAVDAAGGTLSVNTFTYLKKPE